MIARLRNPRVAFGLGAAVCIGLLTLSFVFLGDGLRDALDPRMKI